MRICQLPFHLHEYDTENVLYTKYEEEIVEGKKRVHNDHGFISDIGLVGYCVVTASGLSSRMPTLICSDTLACS